MTTSLRSLVKRVLPKWALRALRRVPGVSRPPQSVHRFTFPHAPAARVASSFGFSVAAGNLLEQLGEKYAPTRRKHNYLPYYWMHLRDVHLGVRNVLEIGVQSDRSIRMWEEFFPNATIHGIDIDSACRAFEGGRRRIHIGDQGDVPFLERVVRAAGAPFDIVIDDGSHVVEHQLRTFEYLFPQISDHGIYVMEDTGSVVGDYNQVVVNSLKALVDDAMYWPPGFELAKWPQLSRFPAGSSWATRNIIGVAFYRWIVFVMRGHNPEDNPYLVRDP